MIPPLELRTIACFEGVVSTTPPRSFPVVDVSTSPTLSPPSKVVSTSLLPASGATLRVPA